MWRQRNDIENYLKNERSAKWHSGLQMPPLLPELTTYKGSTVPGLTQHSPGVGSGCVLRSPPAPCNPVSTLNYHVACLILVSLSEGGGDAGLECEVWSLGLPLCFDSFSFSLLTEVSGQKA